MVGSQVMPSDSYSELFENMPAVYAALVGKYHWVTHVTPYRFLPSIRTDGLMPRPVSGYTLELFNQFGDCGRYIICMHPVGSALGTESSHDGPYVRLAVCAGDLPHKVGLDWSFAPSLACIKREKGPEKSLAEIFLAVVQERGSVAVYQAILAPKLRISRDGAQTDPFDWPLLQDTRDAEINPFNL